MKKISTMIALFLLAFTVITQTAQAQLIANQTTPLCVGVGCVNSARVVVSPYYQADQSGAVYTFIGISHPSLSGSASQIGMRLTAVGAPTNGNNAFVDFTISGGNSQRVFIVTTNHANINPTNITDSTTTFIATSGNAFGSIRAVSSATNPASYSPNTADVNNLSQLSFWGAIVVQSTSTGFAMEFVGDMHDSVGRVETEGVTAGRGIN